MTEQQNDSIHAVDEDTDDEYNECVLTPGNDRRTIICDSENTSDAIIQCIGSIETHYLPDPELKITEKTHGTGTVIHIDGEDKIYVISAAHNIRATERECTHCKTKTLLSGCPNESCGELTKKTGNLIQPSDIFFSRRGHGGKHQLGQSIERYKVENYKLPDKYAEYPKPRGGYDIAIMVFKCNSEEGANIYRQICPKISFASDVQLGGKEQALYIYGYPGDKREVKDHRTYYYLYGMGSSKIDESCTFNVARHDKNDKLFIVNKAIDTSVGQSGSCIYSYDGRNTDGFLLYGIHSGGSPSKKANYGTFFDDENINWIKQVFMVNHISNIADKFRTNILNVDDLSNLIEADSKTDFLDEKVAEDADRFDSNEQQIQTKEELNLGEMIENCQFENESGETIGKLIEIGTNIAVLGKNTKNLKAQCFMDVNSILERVKLETSEEKSEIKSAEYFEELMGEMLQTKGHKYTEIALKFLKLLGYQIDHEQDLIKITGNYDPSILDEVLLKFHHLSNAVEKPVENIYQQLKIAFPDNDNVIQHGSGINDKEFIIFQLPQIVFENQQTSLVNKIILNPDYLERFINYLVPNSSKYKCKEIYFERLKSLQISTIGLFGSRQEVLNMLINYKAISIPLKVKLELDDKHELINPGIHAILPINLHKKNYKWNKIIYVFYWSLPHSFDMTKMKDVKNMRCDPSCLLSRVLYEMSSTVCIQVSSEELNDFGVVEQIQTAKEEKKEEKKEVKEDNNDDDEEDDNNKSRRRRRRGKKDKPKRKKIKIIFEETKENQIVCAKNNTKRELLEKEAVRLDDSWKQFRVNDMIDCRDIRTKKQSYYLVQIKKCQNDQIYIHYKGFEPKWDEWIQTDVSSMCSCIGECHSLMHRLAAPNTQNKKGRAINPSRNLQKITACDTFLLGGTKINGYTQLFKEESKVDIETITLQLKSENNELEKFFLDLNSKHVIKPDEEFGNDGLECLAKALIKDKFEKFETAKEKIEQLKKYKSTKIGDEINSTLEKINEQIEHEFHHYYINHKYFSCEIWNQKIIKIVDKLLPREKINPDKKTDESKDDDDSKGDIINSKTHRRTTSYSSEFTDLEQAVYYAKLKPNDLKMLTRLPETLGVGAVKAQNAIAKKMRNGIKKILNNHTRETDEIYKNAGESVNKWKNKSKPTGTGGLLNLIGLGANEKFTGTDEQWEQHKKTKQQEAIEKQINDITKQDNATIRAWFKLYTDELHSYKNDVYGGGKRGTSILHRGAIKSAITHDIDREYDQKLKKLRRELKLNIKNSQKSKPQSMDTVTLFKFDARRRRGYLRYHISYLKPVKLPPTFDMRFVSIDLPTFDELITINSMKNMQYKMPQTDKLLYHEMMANGETIMFIRTDMTTDDAKTEISHTRVVVSSSRQLIHTQTPSITLKKKVHLVSYCESQKMFAILFDKQLVFAVYQQGGVIMDPNKVEDLEETSWWTEDLQYRELLMQEVNKNIIVWLIDEKNVARAYEYDSETWNPKLQFNLDQSYSNYLLSTNGAFLVAFKPQYKEDPIYKIKTDEANEPTNELIDAEYHLVEYADLKLITPPDKEEKSDDGGFMVVFEFQIGADDETKWNFVLSVNEQNEVSGMRVEDPENKESSINVKEENVASVWNKISELNIDRLAAAKIVTVEKTTTPTNRIQMHAFLLNKGKKLEYKVHKASLTGYETNEEPEMTDGNKHELKIVDNILLPESFSLDTVKLNDIKIQETSKYDIVLCAIMTDPKTTNVELIYHKLNIQVSEATMKIRKQQGNHGKRKITKLDYMEYMIEKFGSRAAIFYPEEALLSLHTTYIMTDKSNNPKQLCDQVQEAIKRSLYDKEKKDFKYLNWECVVFNNNDQFDAETVINKITNNSPFSGDAFIKSLITQIPIQIARGSNNKFTLMFNGEDVQKEYRHAVDSYDLSTIIRFGAYDGLLKSWDGDIIVVTSMGKQSTGKSYMLNHLFGTKFDISGGRCTDGAWLSAKIVDDILYIVCDFEGLGSFERSPQEDTLLATFNAAISNCTIFKCDNRFDRAVEEMFNKFQSGVKYMRGSEKCFEGELMLIIKDVVETGAAAAEADFERHIERLAKLAPVFEDDDGQKQSEFFAYQMYSGLSTIPYPPLATESFFTKLNDTIEEAINDTIDDAVDKNIIHVGGNDFLNFIKLIMAKLHIQDWSAMSGESAKIRFQQIKNNLKNATEGGAIIAAPKSNIGITYNVDNDQNLLILDGNKLITVDTKDVIESVTIKKFNNIIAAYDSSEEKKEENTNEIFIKIVDGINDSGLVLGKVESLQFLWKQFNAKFKRNHAKGNSMEFADLYQLFLDLIYHRRRLRVAKYITNNTKKFNKKQSKGKWTNEIQNKMKICKLQCDKCYYPCLLCKNHDEYDDWGNVHDCGQSNHSCKLLCQYCINDEVQNPPRCVGKCGHTGQHNCGDTKHICGKPCPLSEFTGCNKKCTLEPGHDADEQNKSPCKCSADAHRCNQQCVVPQCELTCNELHNAPTDHQHICHFSTIQETCPSKCQVKCWNESVNSVVECGRACTHGHDHQLKIDSGECNDRGHTCNQAHPCYYLCDEPGNCKVIIELKHEEKEYKTGAGSTIKYESHAEANAERLRCVQKIPIGKFEHTGTSHKCYEQDKPRPHSCTVQCDSCKYFCKEPYDHVKKEGSKHNCEHGNMTNTIFYASETTVDTQGGRKYKVGDKGVAEMCNIFCERLGRGHIHLELCKYEGKECVEIEGRRHQTKKYMPNPNKTKDEIKHSKFWNQKKWEDPCNPRFIKKFDKCDFVCQHPSHAKKEKETDEIDEAKFCTSELWHKPCKSKSGHSFKCRSSHPFSNAHVVFICDISGSMSVRDGGASQPSHGFIKDAGSLDNRLGALYSSIHKFIKIRSQKGATDKVSAIMTPGKEGLPIQYATTYPDYYQRMKTTLKTTFAAKNVVANENFVKTYLLQYKPIGTENYGAAFKNAKSVIDTNKDTVVIFLTDGCSSDNGAKDTVHDLKSKMGKKFTLFCITLGPGAKGANTAVTNICNAAGGKMLPTLSGNELGETFSMIAKQMNTGTFGTKM